VTRKQKEIQAKFEAFTDSDLQHKAEALSRVIPELQEEHFVLKQMIKQRRNASLLKQQREKQQREKQK
jgi:hypothetical protein